MTKYKKGRIWACTIYPESMPTDWLDILSSTMIEIAISPLHDKDVEPDGTPKKAHYHILFNFDGPTTYNHVKEICDLLHGTIPIKIDSLKGMYRYHIHKDNPEKYQYKDSDRILLNGFDKTNIDGLSQTDIDRITTDLIDFCEENNIDEYYDLIIYLRCSSLTDYLSVAKKNTIMLNTFLKSKRNKFKNRN